MVFSSEKIVPGTRVDYCKPIVFGRKVSTFIDRRSAVASQAIEPGVSGGFSGAQDSAATPRCFALADAAAAPPKPRRSRLGPLVTPLKQAAGAFNPNVPPSRRFGSRAHTPGSDFVRGPPARRDQMSLAIVRVPYTDGGQRRRLLSDEGAGLSLNSMLPGDIN